MVVGPLIRVIAKNPAAIAMAFGGLMVLGGISAGWIFVAIGVVLNVLWLAR